MEWSEIPYICHSIHLSLHQKGSEDQLKGPEGQLERCEGLTKGSEGQLKRSEGLPEGS